MFLSFLKLSILCVSQYSLITVRLPIYNAYIIDILYTHKNIHICVDIIHMYLYPITIHTHIHTMEERKRERTLWVFQLKDFINHPSHLE